MNQKICPRCGKEIDVSSKFCPFCGSQIVGKTDGVQQGENQQENVRKRCPNCGKEIPDGSEFCIFCGVRVSASTGEYKTAQNQQRSNYLDREEMKRIKTQAKSLMKKSRGKYILVAFVWLLIYEVVGGVLGFYTSNHTDSTGSLVFFNMREIITLVVLIGVALCLTLFLWIPLDVGCRRFFTMDYFMPGNVSSSEMFYAFRNNQYIRVLKIMILCYIKIFLWSLLLVVPGIMKAYSYRLVPYIAAEYPNLSPKEVLHLSESMMDGKRMDTFGFDLSFIGWYLLAGITLLIVGIVYAYPYIVSAQAGLYIWIRDSYWETNRVDMNQQAGQNMQMYC